MSSFISYPVADLSPNTWLRSNVSKNYYKHVDISDDALYLSCLIADTYTHGPNPPSGADTGSYFELTNAPGDLVITSYMQLVIKIKYAANYTAASYGFKLALFNGSDQTMSFANTSLPSLIATPVVYSSAVTAVELNSAEMDGLRLYMYGVGIGWGFGDALIQVDQVYSNVTYLTEAEMTKLESHNEGFVSSGTFRGNAASRETEGIVSGACKGIASSRECEGFVSSGITRGRSKARWPS